MNKGNELEGVVKTIIFFAGLIALCVFCLPVGIAAIIYLFIRHEKTGRPFQAIPPECI
jgi:hypothetical protein